MWHEILKEIARESAGRDALPEPTPEFLCEIWPALVGRDIARLSSPTRLEEATLHLKARSRGLVDQWKRSPLALLERLRRFSPWPIDNLQIEHDEAAGVLERLEADDTDQEDDTPTDSARLPVDEQTRQKLDPELRSILASIEHHRRESDGDG